MIAEYLEAANKLSELAEEFEDHVEIASILRVGSMKLTQIAVSKGGMVKKASVHIAEDIETE